MRVFSHLPKLGVERGQGGLLGGMGAGALRWGGLLVYSRLAHEYKEKNKGPYSYCNLFLFKKTQKTHFKWVF